jgi:hypothetical protein
METELIPGNEPSKESLDAKELKNKKIRSTALKAGLGIGGIAGAIGLMAFLSPSDPEPGPEGAPKPVPPIPDEPDGATLVNDEMNYDEAFATARKEVGPGGYFVWHDKPFGTYYKDEWESMTPEQQKEATANVMQEYNQDVAENPAKDPVQIDHDQTIHPAVVVHDVAPVATHVTDDMTPGDAFVIARNEVGPGGIYVHQGQTFSTYTQEEVSAMSQQQHQEFINSTGNTDVVHPPADPDADIIPVKIEDIDQTPGTTTAESFQVLGDEYIDDGQGGTLHVAVGLNENEEVEVRVDSDNNGSFDTLIQMDENGDITGFVTEDGTLIPVDDYTEDPAIEVEVIDDPTGADDVTDPSGEGDLISMNEEAGIHDTYSAADFDNDIDVSDMS